MWLLVALLAQTINGTAAVFDKLILEKTYPNPVRYTFWLAMTGLASLILVPFGFYTPDLITLLFATVAGISFVVAMLFYFKALASGQASNVVILMAAIIPITTFGFSKLLLGTELTTYQEIAFILLCLGALLLYFSENKKVRFSVLVSILCAASLMSLSNTVGKLVFMETNFATGFVWIKIGGVLTAFAFLFFKQVRISIMTVTAKKVAHSRMGYLGNRALAGVGSALLQYAILLGIPPLVDATASVQFVIVLLGSVFILKERFKGYVIFGKVAAVLVVIFAVVTLTVGGLAASLKYDESRQLSWGLTFSQEYSESLGLDWRKNYEALLVDLGVKKMRLVAYWDLMQSRRGEPVFFDDLDYQMNLAEKNGVEVILAVGKKVPRWPECHEPEWAKKLSEEEFEKELHNFITSVVQRYKNYKSLLYWQVENEPFLSFGECSHISGEALDKEIALVRSLDPNRKILVTDSGEVGPWYFAISRGDIFGTTMYRRVYNKYLGYVDYNIPPAFFRLKQSLVRELARVPDKKMVVIELSAEPWMNDGITPHNLSKQFEAFDVDYFAESIEYAKKTGFDEYYLWGGEWWYWLKENQDIPDFWDYAKDLIKEKS